jgi:hypothetical protein
MTFNMAGANTIELQSAIHGRRLRETHEVGLVGTSLANHWRFPMAVEEHHGRGGTTVQMTPRDMARWVGTAPRLKNLPNLLFCHIIPPNPQSSKMVASPASPARGMTWHI